MSQVLSQRVKAVIDQRIDSPQISSVLDSVALIYNDRQYQTTEIRKTLRSDLEKRNIQLSRNFIKGLEGLIEQIKTIKTSVSELNVSCEDVQGEITKTDEMTAQFVQKAESLRQQKQSLCQELNSVHAFLRKYKLSDEEIQILTEGAILSPDMSFFTVFDRVQQIREDCKALISSGRQQEGLDLLDNVAKHHEAGYDRIFHWAQEECFKLTRDTAEANVPLQRVIQALKERPHYYNHCKESIVNTRATCVVRKFICALTRGDPSNNARPLEMSAYDPMRYASDLLAWIHQAIASEREMLVFLFKDDQEITLTDTPVEHSNNGTEQEESKKQHQESMLGKVFDNTAAPLKVRIQQILNSPHTLVTAYKLVHLIAFYHQALHSLIGECSLVLMLKECRVDANKSFSNHIELKSNQIIHSSPGYASDLNTSHVTSELIHILTELTQIYESSILPQEEKESDFSPIVDSLLNSLLGMFKASSLYLDKSGKCIFNLNNANSVQVVLVKYLASNPWIEKLNDMIESSLDELATIQTEILLSKSSTTEVLSKMEAYEKDQTENKRSALTTEGLDQESLTLCMRNFYTTILSLDSMQFDCISATHLRFQARSRTAKKLSTIHMRLHSFIQDPQNAYVDTQKILIHSPDQIRTLLEVVD